MIKNCILSWNTHTQSKIFPKWIWLNFLSPNLTDQEQSVWFIRHRTWSECLECVCMQSLTSKPFIKIRRPSLNKCASPHVTKVSCRFLCSSYDAGVVYGRLPFFLSLFAKSGFGLNPSFSTSSAASFCQENHQHCPILKADLENEFSFGLKLSNWLHPVTNEKMNKDKDGGRTRSRERKQKTTQTTNFDQHELAWFERKWPGNWLVFWFQSEQKQAHNKFDNWEKDENFVLFFNQIAPHRKHVNSVQSTS